MESMKEALEQSGVAGTESTGSMQRASGLSSILHRSVNVGETERWASAIGGGALALYGLTRGSLSGLTLALAGGALLYRGLSGHCDMYGAFGINTAAGESDNPNVSVRGNRGVKVERSITINRAPAELFRYWRNFENLPRIMSHLESVQVTGGNRSHWVAQAPAGTRVEWDAEVYNEKENEMIAWRTLAGADVASAGSVHFTPAAGGRGTEVRVVLEYDPPGGKLGSWVANLFGEAPEQQITEDLRRFKQTMEAGETPTTAGQPSGRSATAGR